MRLAMITRMARMKLMRLSSTYGTSLRQLQLPQARTKGRRGRPCATKPDRDGLRIST